MPASWPGAVHTDRRCGTPPASGAFSFPTPATARSFSSRLFLCHVFLRLFFSPGSQRWQNWHSRPFRHALGPPCAAKAQGLHVPLPWAAEPLLSSGPGPASGPPCLGFSSGCSGRAGAPGRSFSSSTGGCAGGLTCSTTSRPGPPRLWFTALFTARAMPWSRMSWAASFISSATLSNVSEMALSMLLKKPHTPLELFTAAFCTAGNAAVPNSMAATMLLTMAVDPPCSRI
mmetsp:Transcript_117619/g.315372  ORF Transcript_117619/g.315372 Transcript_117619/m.315372 type:complete len:230 (-) Transcript_117619:40-729(-)